MSATNTKQSRRTRRHTRVRSLVKGTAVRPRVAVFKSNRNVFVQVIDDEAGKTLLSNAVESAKKSKKQGNKTATASSIGEMLATKLKAAGITEAVFDRGGFKYHGRVKAVADGLRQGGIKI